MRCAALPVDGRVTSPQGWRNRPSGPDLHTGVDLGAPEGTPVYAMFDGLVKVSAPSGELEGYGNVVVLEHEDNCSLYAHLATRAVVAGQRVTAGQQIGTVGRTAGTRQNPGAQFASSGAHLHLEFLSKWPPAGRDLDRLDVGEILANAGVIVPPTGPLQLVCGAVPYIPIPRPSEPKKGATFAGVAVFLLGLALYARHSTQLKS